MMSNAQVKLGSVQWLTKSVLRLALIVLLAFAIGSVLNRVALSLDKNPAPAGFFRGALQGALMPMAFPNLLVGQDVVIYSNANNGVLYKLGYTSGVNACGALFFGFFFWRISRWRRGKPGSASPALVPRTQDPP
jgi:hypothetical protein